MSDIITLNEYFSWHTQRKYQYLEVHFSFHPPNPRKERISFEWDALGRIIQFRPPIFDILQYDKRFLR